MIKPGHILAAAFMAAARSPAATLLAAAESASAVTTGIWITRFAMPSAPGAAPPSVVLRTSGYFLLVPGALGFIGVSEAASQTGSLGLIVQVFISLLAIALGTLVGASLSREVRAAVHTWRYAS